MSKQPSILRTIRSFVKRERGMTNGQQRALRDHWPKWGIDFDLDSPNLSNNFATNTSKNYLDIGFGNGETLSEMARLNPDKKFIGIEVHRPGVGQLLQRANQLNLENIRVINHDAVQVVDSNFFKIKFDGIYLLFADPWPKRKHHKRRIVQPAFIKNVAKLLKSGGYLYIATDWDHYAAHILEIMQEQSYFKFETYKLIGPARSLPSSPDNSDFALEDWPNDSIADDVITRPNTKYERRGQKLGHSIHDMLYRLK